MPARELSFDFKSMRDRACVGVRRAAAFLGIAEHLTEEGFPRSLTLGRGVKKQFLPDPIPEEMLPGIRNSWRSWITGNALRELDQFLSLYLDEAYDMVQQAKIISKELPARHQWKRIASQTNVAAKHRLVLEACRCFSPPHLDDQDCLISLSKARNCLSHDLGVVSSKRTGQDDKLHVKWIAILTFVRQGEKVVDLSTAQYPFSLDPDGPDGEVFAQVILVNREFPKGETIQFTPDELLDICLYYQMVIDRIITAIQKFALDCGVTFPPPQQLTENPIG